MAAEERNLSFRSLSGPSPSNLSKANKEKNTKNLHGIRLWWKTKSVCMKCMVIKKATEYWGEGAVISDQKGRVWLLRLCGKHGPHHTLLCSDAHFFRNMCRSILTSPQASLMDLEELHNTTKSGGPIPFSNLPLVIDVPLFSKGSFLSDEQIEEHIRNQMYCYPQPPPPQSKFHSFLKIQNDPQPHKVVFKVLTKGTLDMATLCHKISVASAIAPQHIFFVEASVERLYHLTKEENSCLTNPRVYPVIRYFLVKGEEDIMDKEVRELLSHLKSFSGLQAILSIGVDTPFPSFSKVIQLMKEESALLRCLVISPERSPKRLVEAAKLRSNSHSNHPTPVSSSSEIHSLPPVPLEGPLFSQVPQDDQIKTDFGESDPAKDVGSLVKQLCSDSEGALQSDDFLPGSILQVGEPLLAALGLGRYSIRPHPLCAFVAPILNLSEAPFRPVSRYFNCLRFFELIGPLLNELCASHEVNYFTLRKLKAIARETGLSEEVFEYLTDKKHSSFAQNTLHSAQMVVIHNNMDVDALDVVRRCNCVVRGIGAKGHPISGCTGCI